MLLGLWLDQPMWLMVTLITLFFLLVSTVMVAITALPVTRPTFLRVVDGVVPAFFSSISILLALLTGFVANDAWERQKQGSRVVEKERANLIAAFDLSIETTSNMAGIRQALLAYTETVIADEWPKMADGGSSSEPGGAALSNLMRIIADPALTGEAGAVAHTALMTVAMNLREARGERLALSASKEDDSKWLTLIFLAALTLVSIGMVHGDKHRAQILTLFLFSSAMIVTLSVIALHERPFDGPLAIGPGAIERAKAVMLAHQARQIGASAPTPAAGGEAAAVAH
ncbi:DUF4239 domain-containing protein [Methylobacterium sp. J-090]|uniref:bestrophin-like domain n=1 Tax=Methylobacterium sp. J-090 TaxID=2836666 RepID=UPI001FB8EEF2|nr:DUF4239 domain-containing protein [Methylobacterium sp. J-090]MCJ2082603.1 DUF4239 domain-containing protein [Methylobacterium sp. J-090]